MHTHNRTEEARRKSVEINEHFATVQEEQREEQRLNALEGVAEMALVRRAMGWE